MERMPFIATHSEDDAERATPPVVMAVTALAYDMEDKIVLQRSRVRLVKKGFAKICMRTRSHPSSRSFTSLEDVGVPTLLEEEADRACGPYRWNGHSEGADHIQEVGEAKSVLVF